MEMLESLKILTEESNDDLLKLLIEKATSDVLEYTHRDNTIKRFENVIVDLAVIKYNRLGTEGESGRSEAGESYSFEDSEEKILSRLNNYRVARCGGYAHEAEKNTNDTSI